MQFYTNWEMPIDIIKNMLFPFITFKTLPNISNARWNSGVINALFLCYSERNMNCLMKFVILFVELGLMFVSVTIFRKKTIMKNYPA